MKKMKKKTYTINVRGRLVDLSCPQVMGEDRNLTLNLQEVVGVFW